MSKAARMRFTLIAAVLLSCSALAPWRDPSQGEMAYRQETMRGYTTFLIIPLLLAGASEGARSDFWMALALAAGWLGAVGYVVVRGTNPDASWWAAAWLAPAVVGFAAVTISGNDPPLWRFWSWGLWLLWVGLASGLVLEATLLLKTRRGKAAGGVVG